MDLYLGYIFALNVALTLVDAAIGYYAAPALTRIAGMDGPDAEGTVPHVRRLLAAVVALYMFFNCLAFFGQKQWLLFFVSAVLAVDIAAQLIICRKMSSRNSI